MKREVVGYIRGGKGATPCTDVRDAFCISLFTVGVRGEIKNKLVALAFIKQPPPPPPLLLLPLWLLLVLPCLRPQLPLLVHPPQWGDIFYTPPLANPKQPPPPPFTSPYTKGFFIKSDSKMILKSWIKRFIIVLLLDLWKFRNFLALTTWIVFVYYVYFWWEFF